MRYGVVSVSEKQLLEMFKLQGGSIKGITFIPERGLFEFGIEYETFHIVAIEHGQIAMRVELP